MCISPVHDEEGLFFLCTAASTATSSMASFMSGAISSGRTADAPCSVFLRLYNMCNCTSDENQQNTCNYKICHDKDLPVSKSIFLGMQAVFRIKFFLSSADQHYQNCRKYSYRDQSRNKTSSHSACGDQCAELVHQKGHCITGSQHKADASPQPFSALHF